MVTHQFVDFVNLIGSASDLKDVVDPKVGDIVTVYGESFLYVDNDWQILSTDIIDGYPVDTKTRPDMCPSCGALLFSNKCEYCGRLFR